jgi:hypothetical protein
MAAPRIAPAAPQRQPEHRERRCVGASVRLDACGERLLDQILFLAESQ